MKTLSLLTYDFYDVDNRLLKMTYADDTVIDNTFSSRNQLETVSVNKSQIILYDYDPGRREEKRSLVNSLIRNTSYTKNLDLSGEFSFGYNKNVIDENVGGSIST